MRFAYESLPHDLKHYENVTFLSLSFFLYFFLSTDLVRQVKIVTPTAASVKQEKRKPSGYIHFVRRKVQLERKRAQISLASCLTVL